MRLFASPRFGEHVTPPGHPERPERAGVFDAVAEAFQSRGGIVSDPRPATREELARVHSAGYLDEVAAAEGRAVMLDPDTFTSPESVEIARLAAGAAIDAARHAWRSRESAMALVRPPGHHAEPDRAMGFCLYNNIAIAAAALRAEGVSRVAIVDFDVHHGNGTQAAFYRDPSVLFVSSHQFPYYPGTGTADETGSGAGKGFTINIPMAAGARDAEYDRVYRSIIVPALERFAPEVMLVSAGYDAHELDPLAGMRMTSAGFGSLVGQLKSAASLICDGRIAFITEGGYHLEALRECLEATIE
jgi:acetoin utilization deacetylase AcuC-like enzyme